jgi:hypothetical protein
MKENLDLPKYLIPLDDYVEIERTPTGGRTCSVWPRLKDEGLSASTNATP